MTIRVFRTRSGIIRLSLLFLLCLSVSSPGVLPCDQCDALGQCTEERAESVSECCQMGNISIDPPQAATQKCQMAGGCTNCACCSSANDTLADLQFSKVSVAGGLENSVPEAVETQSAVNCRESFSDQKGISIHIPTNVLLR